MANSWAPRTGQSIDALYAWICSEPDGGEGIAGASFGEMHLPLVGADMDRMRSLRPYAESLRKMTGYPVRLVRFSRRDDLEDLP